MANPNTGERALFFVPSINGSSRKGGVLSNNPAISLLLLAKKGRHAAPPRSRPGYRAIPPIHGKRSDSKAKARSGTAFIGASEEYFYPEAGVPSPSDRQRAPVVECGSRCGLECSDVGPSPDEGPGPGIPVHSQIHISVSRPHS